MKREQIIKILDSNDEFFKDDSSPALFPYKYSKVANEILALQDYKPTDEEIKAMAQHIVALSKGALQPSAEETIILGAKLLRDHAEQFKKK
jgi:hypothetical protein